MGWAKLRRYIYKMYGKFDFLRILECHKSGRPHVHCLLTLQSFDSKVLHEKLWAMWRKYGGGFIKVIDLRVRVGFDALAYVLKYVSKTVKDASANKDVLYSALLFASNKRLFSVSQSRSLNSSRNNTHISITLTL